MITGKKKHDAFKLASDSMREWEAYLTDRGPLSDA
jgi:hypothetical protein